MSGAPDARILKALDGIERVRRLLVGVSTISSHVGDPEDSAAVLEISETAKARLDEVVTVLEGIE